MDGGLGGEGGAAPIDGEEAEVQGGLLLPVKRRHQLQTTGAALTADAEVLPGNARLQHKADLCIHALVQVAGLGGGRM